MQHKISFFNYFNNYLWYFCDTRSFRVTFRRPGSNWNNSCWLPCSTNCNWCKKETTRKDRIFRTNELHLLIVIQGWPFRMNKIRFLKTKYWRAAWWTFSRDVMQRNSNDVREVIQLSSSSTLNVWFYLSCFTLSSFLSFMRTNIGYPTEHSCFISNLS